MRCELAEQQQLIFVHPYDDEAIIAGQGTVGIEMLQAVPELDTLVVAVGGGGLIAGIAVAAKALKPGIEIIGVQTLRFPNMFNAVKHASLPQGGSTIAEGIAVGTPGRITQAHHRRACGRHAAGGRGRHRAGHRDAAGDRKDPGRGRGRCRAGGAAEASGALSRPQGRPGAGRAATSTRCCWRPSSNAAWCAPAGWRACASVRATCRARWRASPPLSAKRAPTSTRCTTSAPSPCWRRRTWRSNW